MNGPHLAGSIAGGDDAQQPFSRDLRIRRIGIDTCQEMVAYLHRDCPVYRAEGFDPRSRVEVWRDGRHIIATLNVVHDPMLGVHEIGLSEAAWRGLAGSAGDMVRVTHPEPIQSFSAVRSKIYGTPFTADGATAVVRDLVQGHYSDIEMAALIAACSGGRMDLAETIALTHAMINAGQSLQWDAPVVADKHCVGGLPGNRTTLLIVPIVAACGLLIPKTSSRAITSPAGTADTMETLAPVVLSTAQMRRTVERENGCIVWGGSMNLSPADDLLIRVERPLGLDSDGLLVASVLSKKISAGATHVVIDMPIGPTAKVRSLDAAHTLSAKLIEVGKALGVVVRIILTDGSQPVGEGIGPALEAHDVLAVLRNTADAPATLRERSLSLAAAVLELGGKAGPGKGLAMAREVLSTGAAWNKFQAICDAQGGMRVPPKAKYTKVIRSRHAGRVVAIDNRRLAAIAKLAGAPSAKAAGISFYAPLGSMLELTQPYMTIHAETPGELDYACAFVEAQPPVLTLREAS